MLSFYFSFACLGSFVKIDHSLLFEHQIVRYSNSLVCHYDYYCDIPDTNGGRQCWRNQWCPCSRQASLFCSLLVLSICQTFFFKFDHLVLMNEMRFLNMIKYVKLFLQMVKCLLWTSNTLFCDLHCWFFKVISKFYLPTSECSKTFWYQYRWMNGSVAISLFF